MAAALEDDHRPWAGMALWRMRFRGFGRCFRIAARWTEVEWPDATI
jgi:hypothetical protein